MTKLTPDLPMGFSEGMAEWILNGMIQSALIAFVASAAYALIWNRSAKLKSTVLTAFLATLLIGPIIGPIVPSSPIQWSRGSTVEDEPLSNITDGDETRSLTESKAVSRLNSLNPPVFESNSPNRQSSHDRRDASLPGTHFRSEILQDSELQTFGIHSEGDGKTFVSPTVSGRNSHQETANATTHVLSHWNIYSVPILQTVSLIWLAGMIVSGMRFSAATMRLLQLRQHFKPTENERILRIWRSLTKDCSGRQGTPSDPFTMDAKFSPYVTGIRDPRLVLPTGFEAGLADRELESILAHEWAHIVHRDTQLGLFQRLTSIFYWWNPLVHWMNRALTLNRELLCDQAAVQRTGNAKTYAETLVKVAELTLRSSISLKLPATVNATSTLKQRIRNLGKKGMTMKPRLMKRQAFAVYTAALLVSAIIYSIKAQVQFPHAKPANENAVPVAVPSDSAAVPVEQTEAPESTPPSRKNPARVSILGDIPLLGRLFPQQAVPVQAARADIPLQSAPNRVPTTRHPSVESAPSQPLKFIREHRSGAPSEASSFPNMKKLIDELAALRERVERLERNRQIRTSSRSDNTERPTVARDSGTSDYVKEYYGNSYRPDRTNRIGLPRPDSIESPPNGYSRIDQPMARSTDSYSSRPTPANPVVHETYHSSQPQSPFAPYGVQPDYPTPGTPSLRSNNQAGRLEAENAELRAKLEKAELRIKEAEAHRLDLEAAMRKLQETLEKQKASGALVKPDESVIQVLR